MLVSVVLPTYERAAVLGDAIESVLGQTYDELELLVVDDGDDDATPKVVESFEDDRLRYVRREDSKGVSSARNEGVRRTDGNLVAFIDSDDRWRSNKLRRQVAALHEAGKDDGGDAGDDDGGDADDDDSGDAGDEECGVVYTPVTKREGEPRTRDGASGDVYEAVRRLAVPTYTSTLLIRREAFREVGGFDEALSCFEDWDLCLRLARRWRFEYLNVPLVLKGTSEDNVSADPDRLARSLDRLFDAHDLPPEARARFLADAGKTYCEAGRLAEGRPYLRRALKLDFRTNAAAAFALSLSGSSRVFDVGMSAVYGAEQRLAGGG